jgi:hypothetical protein
MEEQVNAIRQKIAQNDRYINRVARGQNPNGSADSDPEKERRQFVAACPSADCRGFLSQAYKCGTCQKQYCSKCRELKDRGDEHTCDPDLVATIEAIVKDSRACPSCGIPISRVMGCDQMYCTQCDTAFSYATGKIAVGVIHNPHYYERQRQLNNGVAPRPAGDVRCGGWPDYLILMNRLRNSPYRMKETYIHKIANIHRTGSHVQAVELAETYAVPPLQDHERVKLRVRFLLKEIDERELGMAIQRLERTREKTMEIREILENYVMIALDALREIEAADFKKLSESELQRMLDVYYSMVEEYVNTPLRRIGDLYKNRVPQIQHHVEKVKVYTPYGAYVPGAYSPNKAKGDVKKKGEVIDLTDE